METSNTSEPSRQYIRHRWIQEDEDACCMVCGIRESVFNRKIENAPMIEWDCRSVQLRRAEKANDNQGGEFTDADGVQTMTTGFYGKGEY